MSALKFNYRHLVYAIFDIIVTFAVVFLSFLTFIFRNNPFTETQTWGMFIYCGSIALLTLIVFYFTKVYRIVTTNFSLYDAIEIALLVAIIHILGLIVLVTVPSEYLLRPSIAAWALSALSLVCLLSGARLSVRGLNAIFHFRKKYGVRSLVIGAGSGGKILFDDSKRNINNKHKIVAFVDDDITKIGGYYASTPICGPIANVAEFIEKFDVEEVIIAIPSLSKARLHQIVLLLQPLPVRINCMPLLDQMNGPYDIKMMRVDIDNLLDREVVKLDNSKLNEMLYQKTVLITGAGGSIGSELSRQIFDARPSRMILFDIYENSTYEIQQQLLWKIRKENITNIEIIALIGSTYDEHRIESVLSTYHPDYIYHAAAYKHVPLMEDSPMEAIRTNVIGTANVARLADKYKVKKMLLVSTDKAVRPTNTMGATKRFAEMVIQYYSSVSKNTKYCAVRFGNVLGSNGSVVPLFQKQIKEGGPITVTDKNIIRYFMTIPEAVGLILHCSLLAEEGELFILDMGTPVSIVSLAERLIRQAGFLPYKDIDIIFTGLRPGEKLYEEILVDTTKQTKTENGQIYIENKEATIDIPHELENISKVFKLDNNKEIKKLLASIITSYTPKD